MAFINHFFTNFRPSRILAAMPKPNNTIEITIEHQETEDIVRSIMHMHNEQVKNYQIVADAFCEYIADQNLNIEDLPKVLFDFCKQYFVYKEDPGSKQDLKSPQIILQDKVVDCKCYSLFIGGVLNAANRLYVNPPFDCYFAFSSYDENSEPTHVFIICNNEIIDCCLPIYNKIKTCTYLYTYKISNRMAIRKITGTNAIGDSNGDENDGIDSTTDDVNYNPNWDADATTDDNTPSGGDDQPNNDGADDNNAGDDSNSGTDDNNAGDDNNSGDDNQYDNNDDNQDDNNKKPKPKPTPPSPPGPQPGPGIKPDPPKPTPPKPTPPTPGSKDITAAPIVKSVNNKGGKTDLQVTVPTGIKAADNAVFSLLQIGTDNPVQNVTDYLLKSVAPGTYNVYYTYKNISGAWITSQPRQIVIKKGGGVNPSPNPNEQTTSSSSKTGVWLLAAAAGAFLIFKK